MKVVKAKGEEMAFDRTLLHQFKTARSALQAAQMRRIMARLARITSHCIERHPTDIYSTYCGDGGKLNRKDVTSAWTSNFLSPANTIKFCESALQVGWREEKRRK